MGKKVVGSYLLKYFLFTFLMLFITSCFSPPDSRDTISSTQIEVDSSDATVNEFNVATLFTQQMVNIDNVMVVAHRACWRLAPENSLKAIEECIRLGVDMVEIDVRRTKDGQLIVIHDKTVDRTTNGRGLVSELTLAEISDFYLKEGQGGDRAALTQQKVPTLEQALLVAKGKVMVNLDAKADVRDQAYSSARSLNVKDQILIKMSLSSPEEVDLHQMAFFGNTLFMPIVREKNGTLSQQISSFAEIDPVAFEVIYQTEEQLIEACDAATSQQARCWVNTLWETLAPGHSDDVAVLDPDNHWGHLARIGVNMIQTDRPQALIDYLASKGLR